MVLSHVRNHEIFVLVLSLVMLTPIVNQLKLQAPQPAGRSGGWSDGSWASTAIPIAVFVVGAVRSSFAQTTCRRPAIRRPPPCTSSSRAI